MEASDWFLNHMTTQKCNKTIFQANEKQKRSKRVAIEPALYEYLMYGVEIRLKALLVRGPVFFSMIIFIAKGILYYLAGLVLYIVVNCGSSSWILY